MNGLKSALLLAFFLGMPLSLSAGASGIQEDGDLVTALNVDRIYHPTTFSPTQKYKKVALVDSRTIFDALPEYKEIRRRKIDKGTAEYQLLITKASNRFKNVISKTVSLGGYDLVAETGAVMVQGKTLPDITFEVIGNLD